LVLAALALPLFFGFAAVVVDGSSLMAQRRSLQNAADSAALAATRDLPQDACIDALCLDSYRDQIVQDIVDYSKQNNGPDHLDGNGTAYLHQCDPGDSNDSNCYTWPYKNNEGKVEVRLRKKVTSFFTRVVGISDLWDVSARTVASAVSETHCDFTAAEPPPVPDPDQYLPSCTIPGTPDRTGNYVGGGSGDGHCHFDPPVDNPDQYLPDCVIPGQPQTGTHQDATDPHCVFDTPVDNPDQYLANGCTMDGKANSAFAASTDVQAIRMSGGTKTFDTMQTNGCIVADSIPADSFARELWVGKKNTCTHIPTTFEPNGPIASGNGATKSGNIVTLTTPLDLGFNGWKPGDTIIVSGVTPAGYNGTFTIKTVVTTTQITYDAGNGTNLGAGGGGMVRNANKYLGPCGAANFQCPTPTSSSCNNSYVSPVDCGLDYPVNPVTLKNGIQAQCDAQGHNLTSNPTWNQAWINTHSPGSYCFSVSLNINIAGTPPAVTFNGYTIMAPSITVAGGGNNSALTAPGGSTGVAFFVTNGLLSSGYCSSTNNNLQFNQSMVITGQMFAPCGTLTFNSGGQVFTGFLEAFKIVLTGGSSTYFVGTGPGGEKLQGQFVPGDGAHCVFDPPVPNPDTYLNTDPPCTAPGSETHGTFEPNGHCVFDPPVDNPDQYLPGCVIPGSPEQNGVRKTTFSGSKMDE
jgi:hypothetical protein